MKKNKKIWLIIMIVLIVILVPVLSILYLMELSDKKLVMYKVNGLVQYYENTVYSSMEVDEYIYECTYKNCRFVGNGAVDEKREIRDGWVIIKDSFSGKYKNIDYIEGGEYYLYNVLTNEKISVNLDKNSYVKDIYIENGVPKTLIVNLNVDFDEKDVIVDIETGKKLFDTDEVVCDYSGVRRLNIVNKGKQIFYGVSFGVSEQLMLYNSKLEYIGTINSLNDFDQDGNIIKIKNLNENKFAFEVYDLSGNLLRTSKKYDDIMIDNGYLIVNNSNGVMFLDSKENIISTIDGIVETNYFTIEYNEYYNRGNGISVFEVIINNDEELSYKQYFYNLENKKLEKYYISRNELEEKQNDWTSYYSDGYDTYNKDEVTIYMDNNLRDGYIKQFNDYLDDIYNNWKFLFSVESNIYTYTKNNYVNLGISYPAWMNISGYYTGSGYNSKNIMFRINDYFPRNLVGELSYKLYDANKVKYNNKEFKNLLNKYAEVFGYNNDISDRLFFGLIMEYYYYSNINKCDIFTRGCSSIVGSVNSDVSNIEQFNNDINKYIENYVL